MRARRPSFLLAILLSTCLVACFGGHGGGGGGGNGGGGGSGTTPTTVQFVSKPTSVPAGSQIVFQAFTSHNHGNPLGVNWTISPASGEGTLSNSVQGNPSSITYTAPMTPCNNCVTITAQSIENPASTDSDTFSITAGGGNVSILFGRYAFLFSGFGPNGVAVAATGSINVDANGNVTGEEDFKDPVTLHMAAPIQGSCQNYPIATTGFCKLTAAGTTYQYDFVLRNNQLVARFFENTIDGTGITGSGVLIAQQVPSSDALTSAGGFNGYFSVEFSGTDAALARIGVEGNIFTNLSAAIVTQNGFPSQADVNDNGTLIQPADSTTPNVTGSMTGPVDANGRATAQMTIGSSPSRTLTLALYILAPESSTTGQPGRAFAIDITAIATSKQVLSGQFFWLGNPPLNLTIDSTNFPVNVFALWGVTPGSPASSSTQLGTFNGATGKLLFDSDDGGKFNGGSTPQSGPQSGTITTPISVAPNGRAILSVTVGSTVSTYVLYLDGVSDGNMMAATVGGVNDTKVSFGFFTGQAPTSNFNNTKITGNYVVGTTMTVLPAVPNGAAPLTLTPSTTVADSGTFSVDAGAVTGNYSFDATTGRGIATVAGSGNIFGNGSAVFYIITPKIMVLMGADQNVTNDAIALMQF